MEAERLRSENGSKDAVLHCYIAATIKDRGIVTAGSLCSCNFIHKRNNTLEICAALTMSSVVRALISNLLRFNDLVALTDIVALTDLVALTDPVALTNPVPLTDIVALTDLVALTDPIALTNPVPLTNVVAFIDVLAFPGVAKFIHYRYRSNNCKISFSTVLLPSTPHF